MVFRNRQKTIRVADVLHGCTPGRIQSVGYMQVIPLVSDLSDNRFVSPVEAEADVFTTSYGTLGFRNPSDCLLIVPCHAGYVVKQAAQDHAMAHAGVVRCGRRAVVRHSDVHPAVAGWFHPAWIVPDVDSPVRAA